MRSLNLYPAKTARGRRRTRLKLNQARERFESGEAWYTKQRQPVSISDVPNRHPVVLNCGSGIKLHVMVKNEYPGVRMSC